ncbi:alpha/beta fold hydrolase [Hymenobacter saemangeumensis]|uniref:Alpha/beta fold hydrolase n=1 Tax=Hymenobacter saemangeumensis TaxID=1084522 RepID=A0ABP8IPK6_9BACT
MLPKLAAAQTPAAPSLAGIWKGPLPVPGGSQPVQIGIQETGGRTIAELTLALKKGTHYPMTMTRRGDTVVFYAPTADCRFISRLSADGKELRGQWIQTGFKAPLVLSKQVAEPVAKPAAAAPAPAPTAAPLIVSTFRTETVTVNSVADKVKLAGTLTMPDGNGPFPAVVLLSDIGEQDRDATWGDYKLFGGLATYLSRYGIAVLRLDDRGVGKSMGSSKTATTADLVRDAQAALTYMRTLPKVDPARLGVIGHGEGGNVALLTAARVPSPSFAVTLAAGGVLGQELLARQPEPFNQVDTARLGTERRAAQAELTKQVAKLRAGGSNAAQIDTYVAQQRLKQKADERKQIEATIKFRRAMLEIVKQTPNDDQAQAILFNMLRQRYPNEDPGELRNRALDLTTPWNRYFLTFDPKDELGKIQCPVLVLQGLEDNLVDPTENLAVLEKGLKGNKKVVVRRLPGINHLFQAPEASLLAGSDGQKPAAIIAPTVLESIRDWVLQQTGS